MIDNTDFNSKVTPILKQLASNAGYKFYTLEFDKDSGYIEDKKLGRKLFTYGTLDINSGAAIEFANNKIYTNEIIKELGIKTPKEFPIDFNFDKTLNEFINEIKKCVEKCPLPAIIKPLFGKQGDDVLKIETLHDINFAAQLIKKKAKDFIYQEYVHAEEIRVVMLGNRVIQAYNKTFLTISGDGVNSIKSLLSKIVANFELRGRNTKIDLQDSVMQLILAKKSLNLNSILPKNKKVDLSYGRNLSKGGNYQFIEHLINESFCSILQSIRNASGLTLIGIDLFILKETSEVKSVDDLIFLEYNASPDMENNFYYDNGYQDVFEANYEAIFSYLFKS